jgi:hypothetical protein
MIPARAAAVLLGFVVAATLHAQTAPPQTLAPDQPPPTAPGDQTPVFRTGVEVLPIDVTVLDREGRQVVDLTAAEFLVEVDGRPRKVLSAEYIKQYDPLLAGQRRPTFDNRARRPTPAFPATPPPASRPDAPFS